MVICIYAVFSSPLFSLLPAFPRQGVLEFWSGNEKVVAKRRQEKKNEEKRVMDRHGNNI